MRPLGIPHSKLHTKFEVSSSSSFRDIALPTATLTVGSSTVTSLRCPRYVTWASLSTPTWRCALTCVGRCRAASQHCVCVSTSQYPSSRLDDRLTVALRCFGALSTLSSSSCCQTAYSTIGRRRAFLVGGARAWN